MKPTCRSVRLHPDVTVKPGKVCGHGRPVSAGRCWGCHLTHLRGTGQGARADRLVELKRQQDEGRLDLKWLVDAMARMYAEEFTLRADDDPDDTLHRRLVHPLRDGRPQQ